MIAEELSQAQAAMNREEQRRQRITAASPDAHNGLAPVCFHVVKVPPEHVTWRIITVRDRSWLPKS